MTLRLRLGLMFGGIMILVMTLLAGVLYWQARSVFVLRSEQEAGVLAEKAAREVERLTLTLGESIGRIGRDVQVGILLYEASEGGSAQRRLIDLLQSRAAENGLDELTAISADGVVLARGHRPAEFGDAAETAPVGSTHLTSGAAIMRLRLPVRLRSRHAGDIEGGMDLADDLAELGRLFSGRVFLSTGDEKSGPESARTPFDFVHATPLKLSDGTVLADLVFQKHDVETQTLFQRMIFQAGLIFLAALVAGGYAVMKISKTVSEPVRMLARVSGEFARTQKSPPLPVDAGGEIGELTRAFSLMMARIEESQNKLLAVERLAAWQDAARMLAHEIKNPLSPIKTTATILARAAEEKDPRLADLASRGASAVLAEITQLEKLLSEFSSFARFPAPKPAPADFNAVVQSVAAAFRDREKNLEWVEHYAQNIPACALDAGMSAEVVRNILKNAIEVMDSSPRRVIHLETSAQNGFAVLIVADSGPGVEPSRRNSLFTPYFTTKPGGTGLGLAVSRKIMIEQGGDLVLLDRSPFSDAPGAAFRASVPLYQEAAT